MKKEISGVTISLKQGDITRQDDCEAIVNAANARLTTGGGVAGAIHRAAGPGLEKEAVPLGPIKPGQAVITSGHKLPNKYVIHCLGPVYGRDTPSDKLLADCYINALSLADDKKVACIAFPAISTGVFGYPMEEAAIVILNTIKEAAADLKNVSEIRIVLFGKKDLEIFEKAFLEI